MQFSPDHGGMRRRASDAVLPPPSLFAIHQVRAHAPLSRAFFVGMFLVPRMSCACVLTALIVFKNCGLFSAVLFFRIYD